jgi:hypothetical protein
MSGIATHSDFAIAPRHRRRLRIVLPPDAVRRPEHRHDGALDKRHRARQSREPGRNPNPLRPQKAQPAFGGDAPRQYQLDRAVGRIDSEEQAARPRIDPNQEGRAEIERQGPAADILDGSG